MHPPCSCVHGSLHVGTLVVNGGDESGVAKVSALLVLIIFLRCQLEWTREERRNRGRRFENVFVDEGCCRVEVPCESEGRGIVEL